MNQLRVRLFGGFEIEGVDGHRLGSRKARTLLKLLALARGRPVAVDTIVDALWPEGTDAPARPAEQVSVLVSRLRGGLGTERIPRTDAGYALVYDWLDVDAATELVAEAERRLHAGGVAMARTAAGAALSLVRGPLLADEPDAAWAESDRAATARLTARVRHIAADAALRAGDAPAAVELCAAILDDDPFDEAAVRTQMSALAASGRQAAALETYERLRERLATDLGVDPALATRELHAAIVRQEPVARGEPAEHASLPGRAEELAALDAALDRVRGGACRVVLVEGEAGIGKTRLLEVWSVRAGSAGATMLRGRCDALERALPLQVVMDAVGDRFDLSSSVSPAADPETGRAMLYSALLDAVRNAGAGTTTVLVLDDVHLAGASTADWIRFAARRGRDARLLIVAARRGLEGPEIAADETVVLGPLSLDAARELVGDRAEELHPRSGGNPLFLLELASADQGAELPSSVRDAVAVRCERMGPAAATLRAAAIVGPEVDLDLLAGVLRSPAVELLDHLEEGVRRGFLVERRDTFAFRHELVREALVAGTPGPRRAFVHREAGRLLADRTDADPLAIAQHARLGGDDAVAADAFGRAAHVALERFDLDRAMDLLDAALALADTAELRLSRARVHIARNENEAASHDASTAIALGGGARAMQTAGWAAYYRREFPSARRLAEDGLRLADDDGVRAACLTLGGRVRHAEGDLEGGQQRLEAAVAIARGPERADTLLWLGHLRMHQGRAEEAIDLVRSSLDLGVSLYPNAPITGRLSMAHALAMLGRADDALAMLDDVDAEAARRHAVRYVGRTDNYRGWIVRNLGEAALAEELNAKAHEDAARLPFPEAQAFSLFNRAEGRIAAGELDEAAGLLRRAEPLLHVQQVLAWRQALRAQLLWGHIALRARSFEDARAAGAAVAEDASRQGIERYAALGRVLEAHGRAASGERLDTEAVGADLEALGRVAGLESWWLTADLARDARVDAWHALAERHAARLLAHAGSHLETFRRVLSRGLAAHR
jgi:DNA-binding SARP family transcriptional activator